MTQRTTHFKMAIPNFDQVPWHSALEAMIQSVDNLVYRALVAANTTNWENETDFLIGQIVIDPDLGSLWMVQAAHESSVAPTTFAEDRIAHPTFWTSFAVKFNPRGQWDNEVEYEFYDLVYDTATGVIAICNTAHASSASPAVLNDDISNWDVIANFAQQDTADRITYSNIVSLLSADNVQDAIDEIVDEYALVNSPSFTGVPQAPTPALGDDTTKLATTAYVTAAIIALPQTGDVKLTTQTVADDGWIIWDDGSIGNAASGATTLADDDDAEALYLLWWVTYSNTYAAVATGRGASAAADFAAGKAMTMPKTLGRAIGVSGAGSGLTSRTIGISLGNETETLSISQLPAVTPAGTIANTVGGQTALGVPSSASATTMNTGGQAAYLQSSFASISSAFTGTPFGSGSAHANMQPTSFALNLMIKL